MPSLETKQEMPFFQMENVRKFFFYFSKMYILTTATIFHSPFITARKRSLGQGNVFTPACDSVHRGCLTHCMLGYTHPLVRPPQQTPLGRHPYLDRHPPGHTPLFWILWDTVNKRAVRILLDCTLVAS